MNIQEEFVRLTDFMRTDAGWAAIEGLFSNTKQLHGFAIDPRSWKYAESGSHPHVQAKFDLLEILISEQSCEEFEKSESCIIEGRLALLDGFTFPLILLMRLSHGALEIVEPRIITMGIGLPIGLLCKEHYSDLSRRVNPWYY